MITLHHFGHDGKEFVLNCDLIATIEITPDTVIKLRNGERVPVNESADEVVDLVAAWKQRIHGGHLPVHDRVAAEGDTAS